MDRVGGASGFRVNWARLLALSVCLIGCGRTAHEDNGGDSASADDSRQVLVPESIQKPGMLRHFVIHDTSGPELVRFGDDQAPRVLSLTHPDGAYHSFEGKWSPSGNRYLYRLVADAAGIPGAHLMLSALDDDFAPRELGDLQLAQSLQQLAWIGDDIAFAQTGDVRRDGNVGHYYWIDVRSGEVVDLGEVPSAQSASESGELSRGGWPSRNGLSYLDRDCRLTYREDLGDAQVLLPDCDLSAAWSPDGSLFLVSSPSQRALYRRVDGRLQPVEGVSDALATTPSEHFNWAPSSSRFVAYSGGHDVDLSITRLAVADGETDSYVELTDLPELNYVGFATDTLLVGVKWGGESYAITMDGISSGRTVLTPLGHGDAHGLPATSSDSSRAYYAKNPLIELQLDDGYPQRSRELFHESRPVVGQQFRLLEDDAGLLTLFEDEVNAPGGSASTAVARHHQYLLRLGNDDAVVSLGSFNLAIGTDSFGVETFQSAPGLGGVFYVSTGGRGHIVDWLGFDDITRKRRLVEYSGVLAGVSFPSHIVGGVGN